MTELDSQPGGLLPAQVTDHRQRFGTNALPPPRPRPWIAILWDQLRSPLILILGLAVMLSLLLREGKDALVIAAILVVNAVVGLRQELRAGHAVRRLIHLTPQTTHVLRAGELTEIPVDEVAVGDILSLASGDRLPADARWIDAQSLRLDESSFTGESNPVNKRTEPVAAATPLADQRSMGWRGTMVAAGRGLAVVTAVGVRTSFGHILQRLQALPHEVTPLHRQLNRFSKQLLIVTLLLGAVVFGLGTWQDLPSGVVLLLAVSLIVSIIPEGLPVVMTIAMTLGMRAMAARRAIVRKLQAVETLGAVTVVATDKTGTLTFGQMMVSRAWVDGRVFDFTGSGFEPSGNIQEGGEAILGREREGLSLLLQLGALNNDSRFTRTADGHLTGIGDPTELALVVAAAKAGWSKIDLDRVHRRIAEIPFDARRKMMITWHRLDERTTRVAVKGALTEVLALCRTRFVDGQPVELGETDRRVLYDLNHAWADLGLRDLAVAYLDQPSSPDPNPTAPPTAFTLVGLVGMRDELRPEAKQAIDDLRRAGIRTIMLTGDHQRTGRAIAQRLDMLPPSGDHALLDGREVPSMTDDQLIARLPHLRVATRLTPEDKLRLAELLRRRGEIVAMTGDGVNDVPALVAADVGVAVGAQATDAAKESADVVLVDGNLASLAAAVAEGRRSIRNIQRVMYYLLASNGGELFMVIAALLAGWPVPLLPTQIIWLNAVTDPLLGIALAAEPASPTVMQERPRRPGRPIVDARIWWRISLSSLAIAFGGLAVFVWSRAAGRPAAEVFSLTVSTVAVAEWLTGLAARSSRRSVADGLHHNRSLLLALPAMVALQLAFVYLPPMQRLFHSAALSAVDWMIVLAGAMPVVLVDEVRKWIIRRRPLTPLVAP